MVTETAHNNECSSKQPCAPSPHAGERAGRAPTVGDQGQAGEFIAAKLANWLDALPLAVIVLNADGRVECANAAARNWLDRPLEGCLWRHVIAEAFTPQGVNGQDLALANGRLVSIVTCPAGREPGQIVVIEDVTENRRLQQRVNHVQRLSAIGEMAAQLAHQIRTPLASAMLYASQLVATQTPGSPAARAAAGCLEQLHGLNGVIRDMLLFARGTHDAENLNVQELAEEIEAKSAQALQASGCRLLVSDAAPQAVIRGSRNLLVGLFENLINNAAQMCGRGGEITLVITAPGSESVEFAVADTGPGVPAELKERIFEPFFTTRGEGTGLGLAVVRAIARDHRASVELDSAPGQGATFRVRFPAVRDRSVERPAAAGNAAQIATGRRGRRAS